MLAWRVRSYAPVGSTASSPTTLCSCGEWCQAMAPPTVTSPRPVRESLAPPARTDRSTSGKMACAVTGPPSACWGVTQISRVAAAAARTLKPGMGTALPSPSFTRLVV